MKRVFVYVSVIFSMFLLTFCKNKKSIEILKPDIELGLPCHISCSDVISDTLPMLKENMQTQIYRFLKHIPGTDMSLKIPFSESWQIEAYIESPSPDYDLWLISNLGDIYYKLLISVTLPDEITGERNVISGLLVSYSAAEESKDKIVSEEWNADMDADYSITISKRYEVICSMSDTLNSNNNVEKESKDVFILNLDGIFQYQEPEYTEQYRAIIQFIDTSEPGLSIDEAWVMNTIAMQEVLEPLDIYFMEITHDFNQVMVTNYRGELVDEVDISDFLKTYGKGYIMLEKGNRARYFRYCQADECLKKILPSWNIEYQPVSDSGEDVSNEI